MHEPDLWRANERVHLNRATSLFARYDKHLDAIRNRAVEIYDWPEHVDQAVLQRSLVKGMPSHAVFYAWGPPRKQRSHSSSVFGTTITWEYGYYELYSHNMTFVNFDGEGMVKSWSRSSKN